MLFYLVSCETNNDNLLSIPSNNDFTSEKTTILVDLKGAINFPNVYEIKIGTILYELINLAGGLTSKADISNINLARHLTANEMIIIPRMENSSNNNLININTGSLEELDSLPGIGKTYAEKIIEYRKEYGFFNTIEDIKKVPGIKDDIFEKIKNFITV
jgi:competence protein ComEA